MISGNGRASNRLVVGRGTDAGSGGRIPHSRSWRGVSRRVRLFAGTGPGGGAAGDPGRASGAAPAGANNHGRRSSSNTSGGNARTGEQTFPKLHAQQVLRLDSDPSGYSHITQVGIRLSDRRCHR